MCADMRAKICHNQCAVSMFSPKGGGGAVGADVSYFDLSSLLLGL